MKAILYLLRITTLLLPCLLSTPGKGSAEDGGLLHTYWVIKMPFLSLFSLCLTMQCCPVTDALSDFRERVIREAGIYEPDCKHNFVSAYKIQPGRSCFGEYRSDLVWYMQHHDLAWSFPLRCLLGQIQDSPLRIHCLSSGNFCSLFFLSLYLPSLMHSLKKVCVLIWNNVS